MEIIVIGDAHLDGLANVFPTNSLSLQENELRKPLDYAVRHGIKMVVFLGDVFHSWKPSPQAVATFYRLCADYHTLDIHIILGNHDMAYAGLHSMLPLEELISLNKFDNVTIYTEPTRVEMDDCFINFLPYPHVTPLDLKTPSLTFAHVEKTGALRDNGMLVRNEHNQPDNDFWVIGHLHTHQSFANNYYVGTPYQTKFNENGEKGFLHLKVKGKTELKYKTQFVPTQSCFSLIELLVESKKDLASVTDNPNHVYKLKLSGVKLPPNFLLKHPNVISYQGVKVVEVDNNVEKAENVIQYGLNDWLKQQEYEQPIIDRLLTLDATL
jgi:DNA repair exonuclease SbcCD nuclease subunit